MKGSIMFISDGDKMDNWFLTNDKMNEFLEDISLEKIIKDKDILQIVTEFNISDFE